MKNIIAPHFNVGFQDAIPIGKCRRHDPLKHATKHIKT